MYKIVQSYWSKPALDDAYLQDDGRFKGGWLHEKYNYMSWALSCLKLRQHYDKVVLFTDDLGKKLLIDKLELPYTDVRLDLNNLKNYDSRLWAVGKVYTYSLQEEPFIHVDGDVYIWDKFNIQNDKPDIVVQSTYDFTEHTNYEAIKTYLFDELENVPSFILDQWKKEDNKLSSINAGIIGGDDISFFKHYTKEAFNFLHSNLHKKQVIPSHILNMFFEEVLFFSMASQQGKKISYLLPAMDNEFTKVTCMHLVPKLANYIHLVGQAKKDKYACQQVERRLAYEFPEYYNKINNYLSAQIQVITHGSFSFSKRTETSKNKAYLRTKALLRHLNGTVSEDDVEKQIKEIPNLPNDLLETALRETFLLEKSKIQLARQTYNDNTTDVCRVYKFLDAAEVEQLLNTSFILSPNVCVIECNWYMPIEAVDTFFTDAFFQERADSYHIIIYIDENGKVREEVLSGWNIFLYAFTEPTIGSELVEFLVKNYKNLEQLYQVDDLKLKVIDFITRYLVMEGYLIFAE